MCGVCSPLARWHLIEDLIYDGESYFNDEIWKTT